MISPPRTNPTIATAIINRRIVNRTRGNFMDGAPVDSTAQSDLSSFSTRPDAPVSAPARTPRSPALSRWSRALEPRDLHDGHQPRHDAREHPEDCQGPRGPVDPAPLGPQAA